MKLIKQGKIMKIYFKTFGCRTNIYDTELMESLVESEIINDELKADIIVVNSCTVTNSAEWSSSYFFNSYCRRYG
jgi:threonylcarbamoyladenosine tRNA methylthiotransferase MtaB